MLVLPNGLKYPTGASAETATPLPDWAGTDHRRLSRSTPSLPAALTTSVPCCVAKFTARFSAAMRGPAPPPPALMRSNVAPRLMLITSACTVEPAAYMIPLMTQENSPLPVAESSTFTLTISAHGATPAMPTPLIGAATMPDTCVAWLK